MKEDETRLTSLTIESLPQELIVEIVSKLVSTSMTPISDINNFRIGCKRFCAATRAKRVGQCISMMKELDMLWHNKERFYDILKHCSVAGNIEASFILGLAEVFQFGNKSLGIHYLNKAMNDGHDAATYAVGILLFGEPATQELGMELLSKLMTDFESGKSTDRTIVKCRTEMLSVMREIAWCRWCPVQGKQCVKPMCGRAEGWENTRNFCNQLCKWSYEYNELYLRW